jgi:ParB/RepB/Spo0J family partition protein
MDSMRTIDINTACFVPNPWQPRENEDPEHIKQLALSIAAEGLMQAPVGRWIFPDGQPVRGVGSSDGTGSGLKVQLAFGHSRLAAYRWLETAAGIAGEWTRMPVVIRDLTDEEMFKLAIGENLARKDLSPIEEAKAMTRYRDVFGKNSVEIGGLFGLSDSGVRNKMRLLKLPEDIQNCLRRGEMAEGVARELLALSELPEEVRLAAEDQDEYIKPSEIIEAAKSGTSQKALAEMVSRLIQRIGNKPKPAPVPVEPRKEEAPPWMAEAAAKVLPASQPEREFAPVTPAPRVEPEPTYNSTQTGVITRPDPTTAPPRERVLAQSAPEKALIPGPSPEERREEEKTMSWAASTLSLTLTFWPEDGNPDGRMVMVGARLNEKLPIMRMHREAVLGLNERLTDLLETLKVQNFGGE